MADLSMVAPDIQLPMNASEQRSSAHFQEINYKYFGAMSQIFTQKYEQIARERQERSIKEKLTEFARPGYSLPDRKDA